MALQLANNESGVIQQAAEAAKLVHARDGLLVCDAVQAAGKVPVDVRALDVDTLALSAHKLYGPKGAGALWIRRGLKLKALLHGGSQERNRRAGTENVAGIVGFGRAATIAKDELDSGAARVSVLRDDLERRLLGIPGARVNGTGPRVPNTSNIWFDGVDGEAMAIALDLRAFAVSTGSACSSGAVEPSHVLIAIGLDAARARASLRFSLGRGTTAAQVDALAEAVEAATRHLRRISVNA